MVLFLFPHNRQVKKCNLILVLSIILVCSCEGFLYPKSKYRNLPDLGNGFKFSTGDGNSLAIVDSDNTILIDMEILKYTFDSSFILASQRPWNIPDINNLPYNKRNEEFEKSNFKQYWIIKKLKSSMYELDTVSKGRSNSNVFGPFDEHQYLIKREELGVPRDLQLEE